MKKLFGNNKFLINFCSDDTNFYSCNHESKPIVINVGHHLEFKAIIQGKTVILKNLENGNLDFLLSLYALIKEKTIYITPFKRKFEFNPEFRLSCQINSKDKKFCFSFLSRSMDLSKYFLVNFMEQPTRFELQSKCVNQFKFISPLLLECCLDIFFRAMELHSTINTQIHHQSYYQSSKLLFKFCQRIDMQNFFKTRHNGNLLNPNPEIDSITIFLNAFDTFVGHIRCNDMRLQWAITLGERLNLDKATVERFVVSYKPVLVWKKNGVVIDNGTGDVSFYPYQYMCNYFLPFNDLNGENKDNCINVNNELTFSENMMDVDKIDDTLPELTADLLDPSSDTKRNKRKKRRKMASTMTTTKNFCLTKQASQVIRCVLTAIVMKEPILLVGETGVGKTSLVQYLHQTFINHFEELKHPHNDNTLPLIQYKNSKNLPELLIINLSNQTEIEELYGSYKPKTVVQSDSNDYYIKLLLAPHCVERFEELFNMTYSSDKNREFLRHFRKIIVACRQKEKSQDISHDHSNQNSWNNAYAIMEFVAHKAITQDSKSQDETIASNNPKIMDSNLANEWKSFYYRLIRMKNYIDSVVNGHIGVKTEHLTIFVYVEGIMMRAMRNGDWILLDEINLASQEVIDFLLTLLYEMTKFNTTDDGSNNYNNVSLQSTNNFNNKNNIFIHPNFRLFACMNPPTKYEQQKNELDTKIRSMFTEIYIPEIEDRNDLRLIVNSYLKKESDTTNHVPNNIIENIISFYLHTRRQTFANMFEGQKVTQKSGISDSLYEHSPVYSLRSLCRALQLIGSSNYFNMADQNLNSASQIKKAKSSLYKRIYTAFLTIFSSELAIDHHKMLHNLILRQIFDGCQDQDIASFCKPKCINIENILSPSKMISTNNASKYVWIGEYPLLKGDDSTQKFDDSFVFTSSVTHYLMSIARILQYQRFPILLQGPTSVGKTSLIQWLAKYLCIPCTRINNHDYTEISDYIGKYQYDAATEKFYFQPGPLIYAMCHGHWIILDELNLAPSEVLEALNRVLDDNRELNLSEFAEFFGENDVHNKLLTHNGMLKAHPRFTLFATQNPHGSLYSGRKVLSRAFRNRFIQINFSSLPYDEIKVILRKGWHLSHQASEKMVKVMMELQSTPSRSCLFWGREGFLTIRDIFKWAHRFNVLSSIKKSSMNEIVNELITVLQHEWGHDILAYTGYTLIAPRCRTSEDLKIVHDIFYKTFFGHVLKRNININHTNEILQLEENLCKKDSHIFTWALKLCESRKEFRTYLKHIYWSYETRRMFLLTLVGLIFNESILLVGPTGCGKTTVAQILSCLFDQIMYTINCHQQTDSSDFIGSLKPFANNENNIINIPDDKNDDVKPMFKWCDGQLVQAMKNGDMLLLDEISLADNSVLERLNSVLEKDRKLSIVEKGLAEHSHNVSNNGIEITAHPYFHLIATMNPGGDHGKKELSPAIRNRFTEIWCSHEQIFSVQDSCPQPDFVGFIVHNLRDYSNSLIMKPELLLQSIAKAYYHFLHQLDQTINMRYDLTTRDILTLVKYVQLCMEQCISNDKNNNDSINSSPICVEYDNLFTKYSINTYKFEMKQIVTILWAFYDSINLAIINKLEIMGFLNHLSTDNIEKMVANAHKILQKSLITLCDNILKQISVTNINVIESFIDSRYQEAMVHLYERNANRFGISPYFINYIDGSRNLTHTNYVFNVPTTLENIYKVLQALTLCKPILLEGSPGVGKTSLIQALASLTNNHLIRINLSENTDVSDLFGSNLPSEDGTFKWYDGPFLKAIKDKHWILIDELNLASQPVLEAINSVLDHRGILNIPELGNKQFPLDKEKTFIFGCQNPHHQGGNRKMLPKSFLNRFIHVYVHELTKVDYIAVLQHNYPMLSLQLIKFMVEMNFKVKEYLAQEKTHVHKWEFNIRDIMRWASLIDVDPNYTCISNIYNGFELIYLARLDNADSQTYLQSLFYHQIHTLNSSTMNGQIDKMLLLNNGHISVPFTFTYLLRPENQMVLQLGSAFLPVESDDSTLNISDIQNFQQNILESGKEIILTLIPGQMKALEWCAQILAHNWMPILVGDSSTGKKSLVELLANMTKNNLVTISLTPSSDTTDLIGHYTQEDHLKVLSDIIIGLQSILGIIKSNKTPNITQDCLLKIDKHQKSLEYFFLQILKDFKEYSNDYTCIQIVFEWLNTIEFNTNKDEIGDKINCLKNKFLSIQQSFLEPANTNLSHEQNDAVNKKHQINFVWENSLFLQALERGDWILIENANLCNASVLDRIMPLFESLEANTLEVPERGLVKSDTSYNVFTVKKHPNTRIILSLNLRNGPLSRAMYNRGIEINLDNFALTREDFLQICYGYKLPKHTIDIIIAIFEHVCQINTPIIPENQYSYSDMIPIVKCLHPIKKISVEEIIQIFKHQMKFSIDIDIVEVLKIMVQNDNINNSDNVPPNNIVLFNTLPCLMKYLRTECINRDLKISMASYMNARNWNILQHLLNINIQPFDICTEAQNTEFTDITDVHSNPFICNSKSFIVSILPDVFTGCISCIPFDVNENLDEKIEKITTFLTHFLTNEPYDSSLFKSFLADYGMEDFRFFSTQSIFHAKDFDGNFDKVLMEYQKTFCDLDSRWNYYAHLKFVSSQGSEKSQKLLNSLNWLNLMKETFILKHFLTMEIKYTSSLAVSSKIFDTLECIIQYIKSLPPLDMTDLLYTKIYEYLWKLIYFAQFLNNLPKTPSVPCDIFNNDDTEAIYNIIIYYTLNKLFSSAGLKQTITLIDHEKHLHNLFNVFVANCNNLMNFSTFDFDKMQNFMKAYHKIWDLFGITYPDNKMTIKELTFPKYATDISTISNFDYFTHQNSPQNIEKPLNITSIGCNLIHCFNVVKKENLIFSDLLNGFISHVNAHSKSSKLVTSKYDYFLKNLQIPDTKLLHLSQPTSDHIKSNILMGLKLFSDNSLDDSNLATHYLPNHECAQCYNANILFIVHRLKTLFPNNNNNDDIDNLNDLIFQNVNSVNTNYASLINHILNFLTSYILLHNLMPTNLIMDPELYRLYDGYLEQAQAHSITTQISILSSYHKLTNLRLSNAIHFNDEQIISQQLIDAYVKLEHLHPKICHLKSKYLHYNELYIQSSSEDSMVIDALTSTLDKNFPIFQQEISNFMTRMMDNSTILSITLSILTVINNMSTKINAIQSATQIRNTLKSLVDNIGCFLIKFCQKHTNFDLIWLPFINQLSRVKTELEILSFNIGYICAATIDPHLKNPNCDLPFEYFDTVCGEVMYLPYKVINKRQNTTLSKLIVNLPSCEYAKTILQDMRETLVTLKKASEQNSSSNVSYKTLIAFFKILRQHYACLLSIWAVYHNINTITSQYLNASLKSLLHELWSMYLTVWDSVYSLISIYYNGQGTNFNPDTELWFNIVIKQNNKETDPTILYDVLQNIGDDEIKDANTQKHQNTNDDDMFSSTELQSKHLLKHTLPVYAENYYNLFLSLYNGQRYISTLTNEQLALTQNNDNFALKSQLTKLNYCILSDFIECVPDFYVPFSQQRYLLFDSLVNESNSKETEQISKLINPCKDTIDAKNFEYISTKIDNIDCILDEILGQEDASHLKEHPHIQDLSKSIKKLRLNVTSTIDSTEIIQNLKPITYNEFFFIINDVIVNSMILKTTLSPIPTTDKWFKCVQDLIKTYNEMIRDSYMPFLHKWLDCTISEFRKLVHLQFPTLYKSTIDSFNSLMDSNEDTINGGNVNSLLQVFYEYLMDSPIGQYTARLDLLKAFYHYIIENYSSNPYSVTIFNNYKNLLIFGQTFIPIINDCIESHSKRLDVELQHLVNVQRKKLVRDTVIDFRALWKMLYPKLKKLKIEYQELLLKPAISIIFPYQFQHLPMNTIPNNYQIDYSNNKLKVTLNALFNVKIKELTFSNLWENGRKFAHNTINTIQDQTCSLLNEFQRTTVFTEQKQLAFDCRHKHKCLLDLYKKFQTSLGLSYNKGLVMCKNMQDSCNPINYFTTPNFNEKDRTLLKTKDLISCNENEYIINNNESYSIFVKNMIYFHTNIMGSKEKLREIDPFHFTRCHGFLHHIHHLLVQQQQTLILERIKIANFTHYQKIYFDGQRLPNQTPDKSITFQGNTISNIINSLHTFAINMSELMDRLSHILSLIMPQTSENVRKNDIPVTYQQSKNVLSQFIQTCQALISHYNSCEYYDIQPFYPMQEVIKLNKDINLISMSFESFWSDVKTSLSQDSLPPLLEEIWNFYISEFHVLQIDWGQIYYEKFENTENLEIIAEKNDLIPNNISLPSKVASCHIAQSWFTRLQRFYNLITESKVGNTNFGNLFIALSKDIPDENSELMDSVPIILIFNELIHLFFKCFDPIEFQKTLANHSPTNLSFFILTTEIIIGKFNEIYSILLNFHDNLCTMASNISYLFVQFIEKGYCNRLKSNDKPNESQQQSYPSKKQTDDFDSNNNGDDNDDIGCGMGEGTGLKNVSDKMENLDQIESCAPMDDESFKETKSQEKGKSQTKDEQTIELPDEDFADDGQYEEEEYFGHDDVNDDELDIDALRNEWETKLQNNGTENENQDGRNKNGKDIQTDNTDEWDLPALEQMLQDQYEELLNNESEISKNDNNQKTNESKTDTSNNKEKLLPNLPQNNFLDLPDEEDYDETIDSDNHIENEEDFSMDVTKEQEVSSKRKDQKKRSKTKLKPKKHFNDYQDEKQNEQEIGKISEIELSDTVEISDDDDNINNLEENCMDKIDKVENIDENLSDFMDEEMGEESAVKNHTEAKDVDLFGDIDEILSADGQLEDDDQLATNVEKFNENEFNGLESKLDEDKIETDQEMENKQRANSNDYNDSLTGNGKNAHNLDSNNAQNGENEQMHMESGNSKSKRKRKKRKSKSKKSKAGASETKQAINSDVTDYNKNNKSSMDVHDENCTSDIKPNKLSDDQIYHSELSDDDVAENDRDNNETLKSNGDNTLLPTMDDLSYDEESEIIIFDDNTIDLSDDVSANTYGRKKGPTGSKSKQIAGKSTKNSQNHRNNAKEYNNFGDRVFDISDNDMYDSDENIDDHNEGKKLKKQSKLAANDKMSSTYPKSNTVKNVKDFELRESQQPNYAPKSKNIKDTESSIHENLELYKNLNVALESDISNNITLNDGENTPIDENTLSIDADSIYFEAQQLSEQLKTILEPTTASRYRGDYKTGKRLNMRRIINYIASGYRNNKIWMRRTKLAKRDFNVMMAIDDSHSMRNNISIDMATRCILILNKAFSLLEIGSVSICKFGRDIKTIQPFNRTLMTDYELANELKQNLSFQQKETNFPGLIHHVNESFVSLNQGNLTNKLKGSTPGDHPNESLLFILSDGRGVFSNGFDNLRKEVAELLKLGIFCVFIILDNPSNKNSIRDIKIPIFPTEEDISEKLQFKNYLEVFPFPFYLIIHDIDNLPRLLTQAMKQWFEILVNPLT